MGKLIRTSIGTWPPGSFVFQDPSNGISYSETGASFDDQVQNIIRGRRANMRLVTNPLQLDTNYVANELSESICRRLKNDGRFCTPDNVEIPGVATRTYTGTPMERMCICGSRNLEEKICVGCGGKRVGFKCRACGNEFT